MHTDNLCYTLQRFLCSVHFKLDQVGKHQHRKDCVKSSPAQHLQVERHPYLAKQAQMIDQILEP